jgi:hypothetical protein
VSKTTYERGETLTYPRIYPTLTFTPIFGHRGDFVWIEEVKAAWPEHDSEFAFVRSTVHDERADRLQAENAELRELVRDMWRDGMCDCDECGAFAQGEYHCAQCEYHFPDRMRELGIEIEVDDD